MVVINGFLLNLVEYTSFMHSIWKRHSPTNRAFGKRHVLLLQATRWRRYPRESWTKEDGHVYGKDQQWRRHKWNEREYWLKAFGLLFYRKSKLHPYRFNSSRYSKGLFRWQENLQHEQGSLSERLIQWIHWLLWESRRWYHPCILCRPAWRVPRIYSFISSYIKLLCMYISKTLDGRIVPEMDT